MNICPCCSNAMLRHISHNRIYWYCASCHQEMPNFTILVSGNQLQEVLQKSLTPLELAIASEYS